MSEASVEGASMKRTSLASLLVPLFRRLADVNASDLPGIPIESRFRILLNVPAEDSIYSAMHTLHQSFAKLELQTRELSTRYPSLSRHGLEAIINVKKAIDADSLIRDVRHINQFITEARLNNIESLGDILTNEFPIYLASDETIPQIIVLIDDIKKSVAVADFPDASKSALLAYVEQLRWAVTNWHLLGGDAIANASGGMLGLVRFIEQTDAAAKPDSGSEKSKVLAKVGNLIDWAIRFAFVVETGPEALKQLEGPVMKLLTYAPVIGAP